MLKYIAIGTISYSPPNKNRKHFIVKGKHILKTFLLLINKLNYNADFEIETEKDKI